MSMQRVEPAAAHALVVEQLRRAVHIGSYVPGDRLPSERALAEQLGVSRATVREAIRVLREEGYVESRRGARGGLVVLDQGQNEERMRPVVRARLAEFREAVSRLEFRGDQEQTLEFWSLDPHSLLWVRNTPTQPNALQFGPDWH